MRTIREQVLQRNHDADGKLRLRLPRFDHAACVVRGQGGFTTDFAKCNGSSDIMQPNWCGALCGPSLSLLRRLVGRMIVAGV